MGCYWGFTLGVAAVIAAAATVAGRRTRRPRVALAAVLALVSLVLVVDVMTGSNLSLSAAFGYSPTGHSRLYGISNYSYGQRSEERRVGHESVSTFRSRWSPYH